MVHNATTRKIPRAFPQIIPMEATKTGLVVGFMVKEGQCPTESCVCIIYFEETGKAERISNEY